MGESNLSYNLSRLTGGVLSPKIWGIILIVVVILGVVFTVSNTASSLSKISPTINTVTTPAPGVEDEYKNYQ
ncbi:hypothetical protein CO180_00765 [candidate division WWE3 bacterium CG_4_9_14_3_um_filter_41_6]|uniref:Uncharacterized protein n=1 Tax=candidate division WWE3 bacterium CG_4_10_14_0_2_um_filter_41_14 TaxID=1975072 RepID=A0A2M7TI42_UNCKA|nr:MAG: hypothetical protein COY32_04340 [candidate division WWE3 bacterium CG_4_10_14_0_2_um_filter_41_14]PJA39443.1 MAG: hypothetical protein CO180_00765 [candidate division WWE3 bacterium CG_4_9_14_3_um_filter_41_6]